MANNLRFWSEGVVEHWNLGSKLGDTVVLKDLHFAKAADNSHCKHLQTVSSAVSVDWLSMPWWQCATLLVQNTVIDSSWGWFSSLDPSAASHSNTKAWSATRLREPVASLPYQHVSQRVGMGFLVIQFLVYCKEALVCEPVVNTRCRSFHWSSNFGTAGWRLARFEIFVKVTRLVMEDHFVKNLPEAIWCAWYYAVYLSSIELTYFWACDISSVSVMTQLQESHPTAKFYHPPLSWITLLFSRFILDGDAIIFTRLGFFRSLDRPAISCKKSYTNHIQ